MLEPETRVLLLDALRPPPGHRFDRAVGTTFTLDLPALMSAPVAFAMLDRESADGAAATDPMALMQAVRAYAERITVFCHAGMVALPPRFQPLLVYLEPSVHEVLAPRRNGIFHPKAWLVRFLPDDPEAPADAPPHYRMLCLSRNLTFDRAWDTVLRLDGTLGPDEVTGNEPLARFVRALPGLARQPVAAQVRHEVERMADDVMRVRFALPEGFDRLAFWPVGLGGSWADEWPLVGRIDRLLVVSPFLTPRFLARLDRGRTSARDVIVSRPESFDEVGGSAVSRFAEAWVLSANAAQEHAEADGEDTPRPTELRGLHAKLYVADAGRTGRVWTGSANATDTAFGTNVEFMVELEGRKARCGVDAFLGRRESGLSFASLLEPYRPLSDEPVPPTPEQLLERRLDEVRMRLATLRYTARVEPHEDDPDAFRVALVGEPDGRRHVVPDADDLVIACWPLPLGPAHAAPVSPDASGLRARFPRVSFGALSSFFGFRIEGQADGLSKDLGFVVNAELLGAPEDRRERWLAQLLRDRGDLVRFLLFLLGTDATAALVDLERDLLQAPDAAGQLEDGRPGAILANLFEPMVRALAHEPARLDDIARLVDDLSRTEEGRALLPEGWAAVWEPIWAARREGLTT